MQSALKPVLRSSEDRLIEGQRFGEKRQYLFVRVNPKRAGN